MTLGGPLGESPEKRKEKIGMTSARLDLRQRSIVRLRLEEISRG